MVTRRIENFQQPQERNTREAISAEIVSLTAMTAMMDSYDFHV